jgi:hypothetical protein
VSCAPDVPSCFPRKVFGNWSLLKTRRWPL